MMVSSTMNDTELPSHFASEQEAREILESLLFEDHDNADNYRFAYEDDPAGNALYQKIFREGCCGSCDFDIVVDGRPAMIGWNYGH